MFYTTPHFNTRISHRGRPGSAEGRRPLGTSLSPSKTLKASFGRFAGSSGMSGTQWAKMCWQAGLADSDGAPLALVDADLVYVDVQRRELGVKGMKLPFETFAQQAIPALAQKAGLSVHEVIARLDTLNQRLQDGTSSSLAAGVSRRRKEENLVERGSAGPQRLYYQHRRRSGDQGGRIFRRRSQAVGLEAQPSTGVLDLSQVCDRTAADVRGSKKEKRYVPGVTAHSVRGTDRLSQSTRSLRSLDPRLSSSPAASLHSESDVVGPERFYYDKTSYTGTAKRSLRAVPRYNTQGVGGKRGSLDGIAEATEEEELRAMLTGRDKQATSRRVEGRIGRPVLSGVSSVTVLPPSTQLASPSQQERRVIVRPPSGGSLVAPPPSVQYPAQVGGTPQVPFTRAFTPLTPAYQFGQTPQQQPSAMPRQQRTSVVYSSVSPLPQQMPALTAPTAVTSMFALSSPLDFRPGPRVG
ncbi:hypothetical protein FOZ63_014003 [Perkinsus olseni]|uniref:Uncharacterized protein n=1 Tax=Perkinsus olseni TaxID=32597 RepID=A0A7J6QYW3_PEROL|nr:hypothetical protein FOZ63_014003 [Perkinsus olseni]